MFGYRTRVWNRTTNFSLNVNNVLDKEYFISRGLSSGAWGEGRSFRLAMRIDL
jgi:outer membrane receptor protein involved in Fe transport